MTALMTVYNSKGRAVTCCNASCYNAKPPSELKDTTHPVCICICGGANHGVGQQRAFANHQKGIGFRCEDLESFARDRGLDPKTLYVVDRLRVSKDKASAYALARLKPKKPKRGDLFAYGFIGNRKPTEGARRQRE
jgi:hypothetical protein